MKNLKHITGLVLLLLAFANGLKATHVAGGNLTYRCLGDSRYEISLEFRRDCFNGAENAQFDDLASVTVFNSDNILVETVGNFGEFRIPFMGDDTLNEILTSECNVIGGDVCVQRTTYRDTVVLPPIPGGYTLAYQRCCRNSTLNNITDPNLTGATYWVTISELALQECNSSPVFRNWPPGFICVNDTFRFDHSAVDIDGDSLVYLLCTPSAGATEGSPKPQPANPPPFGVINWVPGFSENNMMGGSPISIDSNTGDMIAVPDMVGQFLIGVCVLEYRDGVLLSEVRRDFEINVRVCGRDPIAGISPPNFQDCDGYDVSFDNLTTSNFLPFDSLDFTWIFDFENNDFVFGNDVASINYTYDEPGAYTVALIVTDGVCTDTAYSEIKVATEDDLVPAFELASFNCDSTVEIQLFDQSTSVLDILEYQWLIERSGQTDTLYGPTPLFDIGTDQDITVTLNVVDTTDCPRTLTQSFDLMTRNFNPSYVDKIICQGERGYIFESNDPNLVVEIQPNSASIINDGNGNYYIDSYFGAETFTVNVNNGFCFSEGTVTIEGVTDPTYPIADIIQCGEAINGLNPTGPDFYIYEWEGPSGIVFPDNETNPLISLSESGTFYVTVSTSVGSSCMFTDSVRVEVREEPAFNILPAEQFIYCENTEVEVSVDANYPSITWTNSNGQVLGTGQTLILSGLTGSMLVGVTVVDDFGCSTTKFTDIQFQSEPEISLDISASSTTICDGTDAVAVANTQDSVYWSNLNGTVIAQGNTLILSNLTQNQSYIATAVNDLGCETSMPVDIVVNPNPVPDFGPLSDVMICPGMVDVISLDIEDDAAWYDADGNLLYMGSDFIIENILNSSEYEVVVTNEFGCEASTTFNVEVDPTIVPDVDLSPLEALATCMQTDVDLEIEVSSTDMVTWLDLDGNVLGTGNTFSIASIDTTTTYQISVVDNTGCELRDTFEVEVYQDIDLTINGGSQDLFYCEDQSVDLSASTNLDADIVWTLDGNVIGMGSELNDFIPDGDVTVIATSEDEFGCIETDSFNIRESRLAGELTGDEVVCFGDNASAQFTPENPQGTYELVWTPADAVVSTNGDAVIFDPEVSTMITVEYINADNCSQSYSFTTEIVGFINGVQAFANPESILLGQTSQLSTDQSSDNGFSWEPSESLDDPSAIFPIATPTETTVYSVTVTDEFGCTDVASIQVEVDQPSCDENDIFIPNMFTPNNDGQNDEFEVHSNFIDEMRLIVYDRWGEEVFVSDSQAVKWDGTYKNKELEPDVYGYHFTGRCINGFEYTTQGNITLMK